MAETTLPYLAYVQGMGDALLAVEGALRGSLHVPRVNRRFRDLEKRERIYSGAMFLMRKDKSTDISRWTDGLTWSPSRMDANFLVYREIVPAHQTIHSPVTDEVLPHSLVGAFKRTDVKPGGLVKKTLRLVIDEVLHQLVSYYRPEDVLAGRLVRPSEFADLKSLEIRPSILEAKFKYPVKVCIDDDGITRPIHEAPEDIARHFERLSFSVVATPQWSNSYDHQHEFTDRVSVRFNPYGTRSSLPTPQAPIIAPVPIRCNSDATFDAHFVYRPLAPTSLEPATMAMTYTSCQAPYLGHAIIHQGRTQDPVPHIDLCWPGPHEQGAFESPSSRSTASPPLPPTPPNEYFNLESDMHGLTFPEAGPGCDELFSREWPYFDM